MGKFICIGLNYSDHAAETGSPIPKEPIIFMQADQRAGRLQRPGRAAARIR